MRIRTIKPEFWSHPVMVRQDDSTKLLALGLLNYADDEGYFFAEPSMVRAALRPLDEDSTIVRGSLDTLVAMGYAETFLHHTHGLLGRVVNFASHQRVDRPNESRIRVIWGKKTRRSIVECSTKTRRSIVAVSGNREQGTGNEGKEQGTRKRVAAPLACEAFAEFWSAYPRKEAKANAEKAWTAHGCKALLPQILVSILWRKSSPDWTKEGGQFIPHPATWLNRRGWEDERTEGRAKNGALEGESFMHLIPEEDR